MTPGLHVKSAPARGSRWSSTARGDALSSRLRLAYPRLDRLAPAGFRRPEDRAAHPRGAIAVLERCSVGPDPLVFRNTLDEVVQLVHHRVLPTDHVAVRPPPLPRPVGCL